MRATKRPKIRRSGAKKIAAKVARLAGKGTGSDEEVPLSEMFWSGLEDRGGDTRAAKQKDYIKTG